MKLSNFNGVFDVGRNCLKVEGGIIVFAQIDNDAYRPIFLGQERNLNWEINRLHENDAASEFINSDTLTQLVLVDIYLEAEVISLEEGITYLSYLVAKNFLGKAYSNG